MHKRFFTSSNLITKLIFVALVFCCSYSEAIADVLPGSVLPEQVAKSLKPKPSSTPAPMFPKKIVESPSDSSQVSHSEEKISFKFNGVILSGNHIYTEQQLRVLYEDKLHRTITIGELYKIVDSITNYYRNNGYILSFAFIPPHKAKKGVIKIEIVEGYINSVFVTGQPGGVKCLVKGIGERIRKPRPANINHIVKYMMIANEIPNTAVKAILAKSKSGLGASDLNMETYTKPISGYLSYDNYGTRYIGPQQMTGNIAMYSTINSGDATQFTYTKSPKGRELVFMDLNYNGPVGDGGSRWILGDTRVNTEPLFVLQPTKTEGYSNNIYTSYIYPLIRAQSKILNLAAGFNYIDSNTTVFDTNLYTDHLRSLDLGANYSFADSYYGSNIIMFNFRKGLPILGYSSDTNQFTATTSRPGGYGAYTKITTQLSRLQIIKGNFSLLGVAKGQWAFVPLLASEQFTFGGSVLGRGYDPAEIIGDRGASASLELRYDLSPNSFINSQQLYLFYDIGAFWNILVNATSPSKVSASSTGLGTRFAITKYLSGNLMWAQPLTKTVAAEELIGQGWRPRVFFSVVATFN